MKQYLDQINKIQNGTYEIRNRIDGQFIGNKNKLLDFINAKCKNNSMVIYQIEDEIINEKLLKISTKQQNGYYFFNNITINLISLIKESEYTQSIYIFNNDCIFYADDNFEDVTISLKFCV